MEGTGCSEKSALINDTTGVAEPPYGTGFLSFQLTTAGYEQKTLRLTRYSLFTVTTDEVRFSGQNLRDLLLLTQTALSWGMFNFIVIKRTSSQSATMSPCFGFSEKPSSGN